MITSFRLGIIIAALLGIATSGIALATGIFAFTFTTNIYLGAWWASVCSLIVFVLALSAAGECGGISVTRCIYIITMVFAVIAGIVLCVGILIDSLAYAVVKNFDGCYKYNGVSISGYGGIYSPQNCCEDMKVYYGTPSKCFSPPYSVKDQCICCTHTSSEYWFEGVSDCSEISGGRYTNLLIACFTFNTISLFLLILSCSLSCCACQNISLQQVAPQPYVVSGAPTILSYNMQQAGPPVVGPIAYATATKQ
eukprot:c18860_g1_i2.p1 GENE.c18860_g1_i2~~c18860_g1_i2.p1  ORF type:complete len:252 (+),score=48.81 c18860_g1_i2:210-965(+)